MTGRHRAAPLEYNPDRPQVDPRCITCAACQCERLHCLWLARACRSHRPSQQACWGPRTCQTHPPRTAQTRQSQSYACRPPRSHQVPSCRPANPVASPCRRPHGPTAARRPCAAVAHSCEGGHPDPSPDRARRLRHARIRRIFGLAPAHQGGRLVREGRAVQPHARRPGTAPGLRAHGASCLGGCRGRPLAGVLEAPCPRGASSECSHPP